MRDVSLVRRSQIHELGSDDDVFHSDPLENGLTDPLRDALAATEIDPDGSSCRSWQFGIVLKNTYAMWFAVTDVYTADPPLVRLLLLCLTVITDGYFLFHL
jgi:hypothetical protein